MRSDFTAISRCTILEVCELLGLDPNEVATIHMDANRVLVEGRDNDLVLPVVPDV